MCDILLALSDATQSGRVIFGKNSDRPAGECQTIHFSPARTGRDDRQIKCSYVTVPDNISALATAGCRPYWCWGYETGLNEAGVVGGNTAIFTRSLHRGENQTDLGLTGMDLLRLGLERGDSAERAVRVITELLEEYGQWGSAVQGKEHQDGSYDNAFLLADRNEAWILETSGRRWITRRIGSGVVSLSNQPTIRDRWTMASDDIKDYAADCGWWQPELGNFDFARSYGDHEHYARQVSHIRWRHSSQLLQENRGQITVRMMMKFLRDHYEDTFLGGPQFDAYLPDFLTICMHDAPSKFTWGNTATSFIVELDKDDVPPLLFWLAYQPPCSSTYLAVPFSPELPAEIVSCGTKGHNVVRPDKAPPDDFDSSSLWWRFYRLLNEARRFPIQRRSEIRELFDPIETKYLAKIADNISRGRQTDGISEAPGKDNLSEVMEVLSEIEKSWGITG
jgi:secernin